MTRPKLSEADLRLVCAEIDSYASEQNYVASLDEPDQDEIHELVVMDAFLRWALAVYEAGDCVCQTCMSNCNFALRGVNDVGGE